MRELLRFFIFVMGLMFLTQPAQSQQPTILYVSQADPSCDGAFPCFTTIQAAINAAPAGAIIRINAGTYRERLTIDGKNNFTGATEASRIVIEANPLLAAGSVTVRPPAASCANGYGVLIRRSRFITIRGLTITGATGAGIILNGGSQQNLGIHIERSRITANSNANCVLGGINIALGNADTMILNTIIHGNGGNGVTFAERSGGPHWLIQNTIHGNSWNGVGMVVGHTILLVNNSITGNGQGAGTLGGRYGVVRPGLPGQDPQSVRLLNNLICGNRLGEIQGPVLDSNDSGNLTPLGNEGPGVSASSGCDGFGNLYANANGPDNLPHTIDDDFSPTTNSPAIDRGMDPRTLGLNLLFNSIFEDDYASDYIRPADANGDRILTFDIGAFEVANEPPVADAEPDQTTFRGVLVAVNGNQSYDPEGAVLTYRWSIVSQPSGSAISLANPTSATQQFTPLALGSYTIGLVVNDGQLDSARDIVQIEVVNSAPVASNVAAVTNEDTPVSITLTGTDLDSSGLGFTIVNAPKDGNLGVTSSPNCLANAMGSKCTASLIYTPVANFNGVDTFTFKVNDGSADSNIAIASVSVNAIGDSPVANDVAVTTSEDTPVGISLTANDIDSSSLNFSIVRGPSGGTLGVISTSSCIANGTGSNCGATVTYTPSANFNALDSFTFKATDGILDSNLATASIIIKSVNDVPLARAVNVITNEDTPIAVTLAGDDIDSSTLSFTIVNGPGSGTLSVISPTICIANQDGLGCTATVTYTPAANYSGSDSFTYRVNDGTADSTVSTVSIRVDALNDVPVAADDVYNTEEDTPLVLFAPGILGNDNDPDGAQSSLRAVLVNGPAHSANFGLNPDGSFSYTPAVNFNGTDSFTYKANDGSNDGNIAVVIINVKAVDGAPVASNDFYNTDEDTSLHVAARGVLANDNDLDTPPANVSVFLIGGPSHAASFTFNADGSFIYAPARNYNGTDTFTYKANDGSRDSNVAMVTIAVNLVNDSPVAHNDSYTVPEDSVLAIVAPGVLENDSDVEVDQALTVELVSGPTRATSFQLNPDGSFHYIPNPEFYGVDTFSYRVFDGTAHSNVAMAQITVINVNDAPVAQSQSVTTNENMPAIFTLSASDIDSANLNFSIVSGPSHGTLTIASGPMNCAEQGQGSRCTANVGYSPLANYSGADSFTFAVSDGFIGSNAATVSVSIVHVNRPPTASAGGPYIGNIGVPVQFAGSGNDPEGGSMIFSWHFGDGSTANSPNPTYTYAAPGAYPVILTVTDPFGAQSTAQTTATINAGIILNPIGNKTVKLGETLAFIVSAVNTSGESLSLSVAPMPLPVHASFNTATGIFTFRPDTTQVGDLRLTFRASGGTQSAAETITITVSSPAPGGATSVRGQVHNLNNTPLGNVKVTLKASGHTTFSDTAGFFTLTGVPSGTQQLIVNGREANLGVYAILAVAVDLIDGVSNNLASPITLPDVDVDAEVQVSSSFTTVVNNPSLPGVELVIAAGTARNSDGTTFTGKLSINPVPDYGRPESRPEELRPGMAVTIQPAGIRFDPPARLTFPNADGIPPGNEFNLWSLNPDTGKFNIVGKGIVSADGQSIITVEGGVSVSAWHFPLAPSPVAAGSQGDGFCGSCRTSVGSEANLEEGSLYVSHSLPSYRSLGQSRSVSLTYSSVTADPKPIVSLDATLSARAAVPNTFSTRLKVGGVQHGSEMFTDARSLPENSDSNSRLSSQFDASSLPTGRYPYEATVFSNYLNSSIGGITTGHVIVINRKESPFGSGWTITDLQSLHPQPGVGVLLAAGDGTALFFSGASSTFTSPPRDFSMLVKNPDNTYARTFKDGTKIYFDTQGLQTSVVDRNGNTTTYSYDAAGRVETISDPVGLVTTFTYTGGKLQRITDPAGRQTLFQFDSAGNLSRITNPDGSVLTYAYDRQGRLTQASNERGISTAYAYDFSGRFSHSLRPGGETRSLISSKVQGLPNTGIGLGGPANPAQIVKSENARASLTDGRGNTTWFTLDSLGQVVAQTDALGQTTSTQRDANGLPTRITRSNGAVTSMTYDLKGNLLTSTDPVGALTTFTYEPNFSQVKTIQDPKSHTTTINYDAKGNAVEIIDALGNITQMTYDTRGLLTSVFSAFGTPVQTTSSFSYDARGNLLTSTNAKGEITTLAYDNAGNVFKSTDAESRVTQFGYDVANRLISVLDADLKNTQYGYDPSGNLVQVRDAKNQVTTFSYDGLDRMLSATNPLGLTETFNYDINGNLISTENRNGQTIAFNYDALNRLIGKTRPPTSSEIGPQQTTFNYDSVGNLTSVSNPVTNILNQYDLASRLVSTTSTSETILANAPAQIDSDTTIGANDHQFDGRTLQVNGRVLTVDGPHQFANLILVNGAVLTHSPSTATAAGKLDITVTGVLQIDATSRIDVSGRGFLGGGQPGNASQTNGMTVGFQAVNGSGIGAGYGGFGGSSSGTNALYGDFKNPNDVGSGGGAFSGGRGGSGGGLVRIVAQTLSLNGTIRANGGVADGFAAGGSGGGIRIDVSTISGSGSISANGSAASTAGGGGGGGGRVAVSFQNATFDFGNVTAFGAAFSGGSTNGGSGTVYLRGPGRESGDLIFDNNNLVAAATPIPLQASGLLTLSHLRVRRTTDVTIDDRANIAANLDVSGNSKLTLKAPIAASSITITSNSVIRHAPTTAAVTFKLDVESNSLTIDSTSRIDVTGHGFLGGGQPGNPNSTNGMTVGFQAVNGSGTAGSYGGLGGAFSGATNSAYGDFRNPNQAGSGGGGFNTNAAGNGGGLVRIVTQTLTLNGAIRADGGAPLSGGFAAGGSGGGIRLDVAILSGTGTISANGSASTPSGGGGGGGGRVALYYQDAGGFNFGNITASGAVGNGALNGGAGTVFLQGPAREVGELIVDNHNVIAANDSTPLFTLPTGSLTISALKVHRGAKAKIDVLLNVVSDIDVSTDSRLATLDRLLAATIQLSTRSSLDAMDIAAATSFQINDSSTVAHPPTTGSAVRKLLINAGTLSIDPTSRIDVTGRGFLGGGQPGNPDSTKGMTLGFQAVNGSGTAGSYGGLGGAFSGATNSLYGDFRNPNEVGSGGGGFNTNAAGNGGGLVRIVAQTLTLNGVITANGGAPLSGGFAAGGSGGGIRIDAGILTGIGSINANGSSSTPSGGGGGGGGRIAVYYQNAASFNVASIVAAGGSGSGAPNGQSGTVHFQQQLATIAPSFQHEPVTIALLEDEESVLRQERPFFANASDSEMPARRDVSASELPNGNSQPDDAQDNLYLAMVSRNKLSSSFSGAVIDDLDPIYTYDPNGNRIAMIDPTGLTTYSYDALNRLTSITNNKGQTTGFTYDALGRRTSLAHANGVLTNYTYDAASQLTRLSHELGAIPINSFDYTYDRVGNRKTKTDRNGSYNYTYDTLNRLTQALNPLPSNPLESFTYDQVGNRTNSNQNGGSAFNESNELLEDASFTYEYDNNGNQTRKIAKAGGTIVNYEYDAENRLMRVVSSTGAVSTYKYDGIGRRVEKEVVNVVTNVTRYVYDSEDILLELDGANEIIARYTHGPGIDEPLIMDKNNQSFFYHRDGLSSVTEISNQSGTIIQQYAYSSFGKIESMLASAFNQPYTFTAREFESETDMYYYRARYYEPRLGRFLQRDPIGIAAGPNDYVYSNNMPATFIDPLGLDYVDVAANYAAGVGDAITIGATNYIRDRMEINAVVDPCSWSYWAGSWTGFFHGIAAGGASLLNGGARTVLWSGTGAKQAALAGKGAGKLLTDTPMGKVLELVDDYVRLPQPVWNAASAVFAANAKGEVRVFLQNPRAGGVWNSVEKPILGMINRAHSAISGTPATMVAEVIVR